MLKSYLPALVFIVLGIGVGAALTMLNGALGPRQANRRPSPAKTDPYECGLPSDVRRSFRFGISFYLIAMLFILFDIEVVFLYPIAVQVQEAGVAALVKIAIFVSLLLVAFLHQWRRGSLEWK